MIVQHHKPVKGNTLHVKTQQGLNLTVKQSSPADNGGGVTPSSLALPSQPSVTPFILRFQFHEQTRPQTDLSINIRGRLIT